MGSVVGHSECYYIYDANGRKKVVDGKEYLITEEEYRRENPYHKDVGCTECSFVQDNETLFTYLVPREMKERATGDPEFVGKFTLPGYTGHFSFYVFKCPFCMKVSVSSISSVRRLWCTHCGDYYRLDPIRHRSIITRDREVSDEVLKYYTDKDKEERRRKQRSYLFGLFLVFGIVTTLFLI